MKITVTTLVDNRYSNLEAGFSLEVLSVTYNFPKVIFGNIYRINAVN